MAKGFYELHRSLTGIGEAGQVVELDIDDATKGMEANELITRVPKTALKDPSQYAPVPEDSAEETDPPHVADVVSPAQETT